MLKLYITEDSMQYDILDKFKNEDMLDKLYDLVDKYNSSTPVSGSWDTETEHEQRAIANEFNIPLKAAKDVMINILGFDEGQFRKHKLNVVTEIRNTDMLNILYDLDDEYNALHKSKADVKQEQEAIADTFDISMDDAKWIMMDVLYFKESQFDDIAETPSSKITSNILDMFEDEDMLDRLYDIADRYNTSSPVSGSWSTEIEHEQQAIADAFNISLEAAKKVMINILGLDNNDFNKSNSVTPVKNNDNDYIKIGKAIANYYEEISFDRNGIIIYTDNQKALYKEITDALKSIDNI